MNDGFKIQYTHHHTHAKQEKKEIGRDNFCTLSGVRTFCLLIDK